MHFCKLQTILPILALLLMLPVATAVRADPPDAIRQDTSKKRIERVRAFLLRSSDEMSRSLIFANGTGALVKEWTEPGPGREPDFKAEERVALLEWYQRYAEWLRAMSADLEITVSSYYSHPKANSEWIAWYEDLANEYRRSAGELGATVQKLDGEKNKTEARMQKLNTAVVERRVRVDQDDMELANELWPTYRASNDHREAKYKDLTDEEVLRLQNDLRSLGERQKYFECLTELGKYEKGWQDLKAGDSDKLSEIARVIGGDDPGAVVHAISGTMRTYEADIAALRRRSGELDAKIHGITRTGSLKTLDRLEELSRYYEQMKSRFDRHIEWLKGQVGGYQADLAEIGKEL